MRCPREPEIHLRAMGEPEDSAELVVRKLAELHILKDDLCR